MKFLVDMNLSPRWCGFLQAAGWDSVHWSQVGAATAPDHELMQWALNEQRVVLTHDLDYGAMLAATKAMGPSVVQVRTQDVRPESLAPLLIPVLKQTRTNWSPARCSLWTRRNLAFVCCRSQASRDPNRMSQLARTQLITVLPPLMYNPPADSGVDEQ